MSVRPIPATNGAGLATFPGERLQLRWPAKGPLDRLTYALPLTAFGMGAATLLQVDASFSTAAPPRVLRSWWTDDAAYFQIEGGAPDRHQLDVVLQIDGARVHIAVELPVRVAAAPLPVIAPGMLTLNGQVFTIGGVPLRLVFG